MNIPYGYCHCGCNQKTNLAVQTNTQRGWIKGEPIRFIHNHHCLGANHAKWKGGKRLKGNYIEILVKEHPRSSQSGYIYEHRLIAEKTLGKSLPLNAVIHHYNGYDPINKNKIVICENNSYHHILDARQKALHECGHAHWRKCTYCHQYDDPKNLYIRPTGKSGYHRFCNAKYHRERKQRLNSHRWLIG